MWVFFQVDYGANHERMTKQEEIKMQNTLLNHVNESMHDRMCTV